MLGASIDKLRQTIDQLADAAHELGAEELVWSSHREQLIALERERERLESVIGRLVSDAEARGASARDGRRSMADWLAVHTGQRRAVAGSRSWLATRLRSMPETDAALSAGDITASHATVLTRAQNPRTQEAFERDEKLLVHAARTVTADQLVQVVAHWLRHVDLDGSAPAAPQEDVFHLSTTIDGRLKGDFDLGGEAAIRAKAIIDEAMNQMRRRDKEAREADPSDGRAGERAAQRRARVLMELLDRASVSPRNPARRQPLFNITTTLQTITGTGDPLDWRTEADLVWNAAVPGSILDRWGCDGHFARTILDADSQPLDVGRSKRLATEAQRRALFARHGGCAVPDCGAPAGRTEIHHVEEWDDGGPTDLDNLVPACTYHHHRIHDGSLDLEIIDGQPVFTLADDRPLHPARAGPSVPAA